MKKIKILATGGTIAGKAASGTQMTGYTAGAYSVADLLAGVPELGELAHISGEQLCNIDSSSITDALLLRLAQRCNELLAQDDVDGVVITHGTDTMEETAFFLNLTVKSAKPVVLVGAMRPATAVSADGPLNIINAVKVAVDDASVGQGVLVMMNDEIYSGRDVTKMNTVNVATFKAPNGGPLGFIVGGEVHYYYRSMRPHTLLSEFDVTDVTALPRVDIIYTHMQSVAALRQAQQQRVRNTAAVDIAQLLAADICQLAQFRHACQQIGNAVGPGSIASHLGAGSSLAGNSAAGCQNYNVLQLSFFHQPDLHQSFCQLRK